MAIPSLKMNNGLQIPPVGLGTWLLDEKEQCYNAVNVALDAGYRLFDTAQAYNNEEFLGEALKKSGIKREDLFITTKIKVDNMGYRLEESFEQSLQKLQTDYVDLLLLHFPETIYRRPAWIKMEEIYKSGRAKSIGVSNYMIRHLEELLKEGEIKPAVNQFELNIFLQSPELVKYCQDQEIVVEAQCPLARGNKFDDSILQKVAKKLKKTPAQIMIRWCIDIGTVVIPKSAQKKRIKENMDVFDFKLDAQDMADLKKLDSNFRVSWDPTHVP